MAEFTNTAKGLRGINMKNRETIFIGAGETMTVDKRQVANVHEDITEAKEAKKADKADD